MEATTILAIIGIFSTGIAILLSFQPAPGQLQPVPISTNKRKNK